MEPISRHRYHPGAGRGDSHAPRLLRRMAQRLLGRADREERLQESRQL